MFFRTKDFLIRLGALLTFFEVITNFLNPLNIYIYINLKPILKPKPCSFIQYHKLGGMTLDYLNIKNHSTETERLLGTLFLTEMLLIQNGLKAKRASNKC